MGGFLMSLMLGFPGLQIGHGEPHTWAKREAFLPKGWTEIEIGRLWLKGRSARLSARHGKLAAISYL
jgi:hypothetical protein